MRTRIFDVIAFSFRGSVKNVALIHSFEGRARMNTNNDNILRDFLRENVKEGLALAEQSDLFRLTIGPGDPPSRLVAEFRCKGLCRDRDSGDVSETALFRVGLWFGPTYVRGPVDQARTLTWLGPREIWHPNISDIAPLICIGDIQPATPLTSLCYRIYDLIVYRRYAAANAFNDAASQWARNNQHRFPVDPRPLKWRAPTDPTTGGPKP
jgi:hypothetical protein